MKSKKQLYEFISKQKVSFISSIDEDGFPNTKAMFAPRKINGNQFYFSTNTSSLRSQQYINNPNACLYFYSKTRYRFEGLMLTGTMEVMQDEQTKEEIWLDGDTMYYKKGVTDPDYCVLRFTATKGRHYCNFKTDGFVFADLT